VLAIGLRVDGAAVFSFGFYLCIFFLCASVAKVVFDGDEISVFQYAVPVHVVWVARRGYLEHRWDELVFELGSSSSHVAQLLLQFLW
jgi:hypothetical protein